MSSTIQITPNQLANAVATTEPVEKSLTSAEAKQIVVRIDELPARRFHSDGRITNGLWATTLAYGHSGDPQFQALHNYVEGRMKNGAISTPADW